MAQTGFSVLFDLDGTLLNTLADFADAVNCAMRELGYPEKTDADVLAAIGNGVRRAIVAVLPAGAGADIIDAALAIFRRRYAQCYMMQTQPYPGVAELVRELRGDGCKIAVISNKTDEYTAGLIERHFGGQIDAAMGERAGVPLKPDPEAVRAALAAIGGDPARAVYVGDSEVDVATARNAGIPCILVDWGFRVREVLLSAGADPATIFSDAGKVLAAIRAMY